MAKVELPITTIFEVIFSVFLVSVGLTAGEGETRGLGDAVGEIDGVGLGEISGLACAIVYETNLAEKGDGLKPVFWGELEGWGEGETRGDGEPRGLGEIDGVGLGEMRGLGKILGETLGEGEMLGITLGLADG